jgi:hypothetical protein
MPTHDRETLEAALIGYEHQKNQIQEKLEQLRAHLGGRVAPRHDAQPTGKRVVSAAARKRMAEGQRKRWAAKAVDSKPAEVEVKTSAVKKRPVMSEEGRKRIAAAQRARWAKSKKTAKRAAK